MTSGRCTRWLYSAIWGIDWFLFQPRDRMPLQIMRIIFGLFLVGYFSSLHFPAMMLYGTDGLVSRGCEFPLSRTDRPQLFHLLSDHSDLVVWLVTSGGIASGLWLASGVLSRLAPLVVWLFVSSVVVVIPGNSGDLLVMSYATYLAAGGFAGHLAGNGKGPPQRFQGDTGEGQSLEVNRQKRPDASGVGKALMAGQALRRMLTIPLAGDGPAIPAWSIRLFQVQLVFVYFFTGYHKLANDAWYHATAMHYIVGQTFWSRIDMTRLLNWSTATSIATTVVLLFELLAFPVLVWVKSWRIPILLAGVIFHVTIYITMRVFTFHQIMMLYYLAFLLPEDWQAAADFLRPLQKFLVCWGWPRRATYGSNNL